MSVELGGCEPLRVCAESETVDERTIATASTSQEGRPASEVGHSGEIEHSSEDGDGGEAHLERQPADTAGNSIILLGARELAISHGDNPEYWDWRADPNSL